MSLLWTQLLWPWSSADWETEDGLACGGESGPDWSDVGQVEPWDQPMDKDWGTCGSLEHLNVAESHFHGNIEQERWKHGKLSSERRNLSSRFGRRSSCVEHWICAHETALDPTDIGLDMHWQHDLKRHAFLYSMKSNLLVSTCLYLLISNVDFSSSITYLRNRHVSG